MAIPSYNQFYDSILELLSDGKAHDGNELREHCALAFHLSPEEQEELLPSGTQTVLNNRLGWARTYLKKAGLIAIPSWGHYQITDLGKKVLADKPEVIDNAYLTQFKGFQEFMHMKDGGKKSESVGPLLSKEQTPQETMKQAYDQISAQLEDELKSKILNSTPAFFERLVMELLEKMGYGGQLAHPSEVTGKTGDEGIDGIIREDTLGFDKIYVQAKRWSEDHTVGEPDIEQFAGALMGKGATKGLFITTSHFSKQAIAYVDKHMSAKIVLVDGDMLTGFMVKYGLGVSTIQVYEIKRIDTDYFQEESD